MAYEKPLPTVDTDSREYWEGCRRGELLLPHCQSCDKTFFPPRQLCPGCLTPDVTWRKASGKGTVYSCSVVHRNQGRGFRDEGPYVVAYVTLEEGVQMMTNVVADDPYDVKVGASVELFFEEATEEISIPKFRLA